MKKKKGSLLVDVLMGMMILLIGILPLVAAMGFAYSATTSSVDKMLRLNELYSSMDIEILQNSMLGMEGPFLGTFATQSTAVSRDTSGYPPPLTPALHLHYTERPLPHVDGREAGAVRLFIIR